jgi:predicted nucleic acid-binding protein
MILVDTSAWVEFLQGTGSDTCERVSSLLGSGLATTDAVRMEVLAGARHGDHARSLRRLLLRARLLGTVPGVDFHRAAGLYRACRTAGETPRSLLDCLIAAVAIRHDVAVLHADRDFGVIARHSPMAVDLASTALASE